MEDIKEIIEIKLSYQGKTELVKTNLENTIKEFIEEIKKTLQLPEQNEEGKRLYYSLKLDDKIIWYVDQTLFDCEAKDGNELILEVEPMDKGEIYVLLSNNNIETRKIKLNQDMGIELIIDRLIKQYETKPETIFKMPRKFSFSENPIVYYFKKGKQILAPRREDNMMASLADYNIKENDKLIVDFLTSC